MVKLRKEVRKLEEEDRVKEDDGGGCVVGQSWEWP